MRPAHEATPLNRSIAPIAFAAPPRARGAWMARMAALVLALAALTSSGLTSAAQAQGRLADRSADGYSTDKGVDATSVAAIEGNIKDSQAAYEALAAAVGRSACLAPEVLKADLSRLAQISGNLSIDKQDALDDRYAYDKRGVPYLSPQEAADLADKAFAVKRQVEALAARLRVCQEEGAGKGRQPDPPPLVHELTPSPYAPVTRPVPPALRKAAPGAPPAPCPPGQALVSVGGKKVCRAVSEHFVPK